MKDDVLQRIKSMIDEKFSSESQFAKAIGVNQNTLNQQMRGKRALSIDVIISILSSFEDISSEWLMRGEGPMLRSDPSQSIGDISGSTVVGNNVHGSGNNITNNSELAALQQQYLEMLKKRDEQIDRLLGIMEKMGGK